MVIRSAGIGGCVAPDGSIDYRFHISVVALQNLVGVISLLGQILTAPLAQALAGDGGAVAEFGGQRLYKSGPTEVIVEQFIHKPGNIVKIASAIDEILVIGGGTGDVEIIAPAAVEFGVYPVQRKGNNGQDICPEGAFVPGGVDFAGGNVLYIV